MKLKSLVLLVVLNLTWCCAGWAEGSKSYQITGTIVAASGRMVTIEKGGERWQLDLDPATTKGTAALKVGATVTVTYVMSALRLDAGAVSSATESAREGATEKKEPPKVEPNATP